MIPNNHSILFENLQFEHNSLVNVSWENTPVSFPTHWHTFGEVVLALMDHVILTVQNHEYHLMKNDVLFIWPGELHSTIHTSGSGSHLIIQFANNLLSGNAEMSMLQNHLLTRHFVSSIEHPHYAQQLGQKMLEIQDTFYHQPAMNNLRMSIAMYQIFLLMYDCCTQNYTTSIPEDHTSRASSIQAVTRACCYIAENCEKNLCLEDVAEYTGISKYHFSRIFKEHTKSTFCDYLALQRIQKAILLFENPEISITEAAFQAGFGSIASFNRCFKKYKNCTPSDYRTLLRTE